MKLISNGLSLFIINTLIIMWLQSKPEEYASSELPEDELRRMVETIHHEGRRESILGQAAVAHVVLNRVKSPLYPDSVCEVVWQPGKFLWTEDGRSDRVTDLDAGAKAVDLTLAVTRGKIKDPGGGHAPLPRTPQGRAGLVEPRVSAHRGRTYLCQANGKVGVIGAGPN